MQRTDEPAELRVRTWLAPSIPLAFFERIAARIATHTGRRVTLSTDPTCSGPPPWRDDPFSTGEVDIGFLCHPSYVRLTSGARPSVVAVPAHLVPDDPRCDGRPVYFSDVIVPSNGARHFDALRGGRWTYNDPCSLSGWLVLQAHVADVGSFFDEVVQSGSHLASIRMVASERADAAAIDSNVLARVLAADPSLRARIRVLTTWGPHPIQPVVGRAGLSPSLLAAVGDALCAMPAQELAPFGFARFVHETPLALVPPLCA